MKTRITLALFVFFSLTVSAHKTDPVVNNPYELYFAKAYSIYPSLPHGILEAVAFNNTRFNHISHPAGEPESCSGMPKAYGVMGLIFDGKNYFKNNFKLVAKRSGYSEEEILSSPEKNILAYAKALDFYLHEYEAAEGAAALASSLVQLSELPYGTQLQNFTIHTQIYGYFAFMNDPQMQMRYKFPSPGYDLKSIFGEENYKVLSARRVIASKDEVTDELGNRFGNNYNIIQSADYAPALWVASPNFNSRGGTAVTAVTIHDMEGSYAGAISWFQNTSSQVSAHYCLRSSDGQITQMVLEANRAWHVGSENNYTVGLEHEGYASQTGWYTTNMYQQSALLVKDICADHSISPKRTLFQPWGSTTYYSQSSIPGSCTKVKGHQHYPNQTHTDPGPNWDWNYYYKLVNDPAPTATTYTTATGNLFDSGGSGGNYSDDERVLSTIAPSGATNVTLTFNSFDVENTWDYLYVYDGADVWSPLIGYYTGTTNPGTLVASSGTITLEFRSDCATNAAGWNASWSSNASTIIPANLAITTATCPQDSVTLKWTNSGSSWFVDVTDDPTWTDFYNKAVPNATSVGCPGGFANYTNTSLYLAFAPNTTYYWRLWDGSNHTYGNSFMTPSCIYQDTTCSGNFYDTGGPTGNYSGNEDYVSVFEPNNAATVSMTFSSFDTEANFDSMWVYNGNSTAAPLLGVYTGTVSPGTILANNGAMTVRFKADPFVNHAGWNATWSCTQNTTGVKETVGSMPVAVYPNPFDQTLTVSYVLEQNSQVKISLVDVLGRESVLQDERMQTAGTHKASLDLHDHDIKKGVYFLKLDNGRSPSYVKLMKQ